MIIQIYSHVKHLSLGTLGSNSDFQFSYLPVKRRNPTPPRIRKTDAPRIGIFPEGVLGHQLENSGLKQYCAGCETFKSILKEK